MTLARALTTIGSWTLVSRVLGFVRDMLIARYLGAGFASDCFNAAFKLPNLFRSLFAEGAFSAAFVPAFARKMRDGDGGLSAARQFAEEVLAVFIPVLLLVMALGQILMPWIAGSLFSGFDQIPGKMDFTVYLSRLTFPYLMLISLAALLSGILNSLSRFAAAAATPIFLNLCLISAVLIWQPHISAHAVTANDALLPDFLSGQRITATAQAIAVSVAGACQFLWLLLVCRQAGVPLRLRLPRVTPDVSALLRVILPATFGAGIYQVSQFINSYFASHLPQGAMSHLFYADRLNQLPLGVVGIALGTAILPSISRHVADNNKQAANDIHNRAAEIALLVCLPATIALAVCAVPLTKTFFMRGAFTATDAYWTGYALMGLVVGLPAYVLIRILTPGFFARGDTRTPVITASLGLIVNILLNIAALHFNLNVFGLSLATALGAWVNCGLLYYLLHRQGHLWADARLLKRVLRQVLATGIMGLCVGGLAYGVRDYFDGPTGVRILSLTALVVPGILIYLLVGGAVGAFDRDQIYGLLKRKRKADKL
jgi:putative peptidoglycan lipid II flippase